MWGIPFIYENRRGFSGKDFAYSGATKDQKRIYSIRVDDGIYVWSLGARKEYPGYSHNALIIFTASALVAAISLLFLGLYIRQSIRDFGSRRVFIRYAAPVLSSLAAILVGFILAEMASIIVSGSCYRISVTGTRSPEDSSSYLRLLRKYRDNGVISESAYEKVEKNIYLDPPE
jgi:hypothetical protein